MPLDAFEAARHHVDFFFSRGEPGGPRRIYCYTAAVQQSLSPFGTLHLLVSLLPVIVYTGGRDVLRMENDDTFAPRPGTKSTWTHVKVCGTKASYSRK
ncbi:unnamed protein product [Ectocarpus sp. 4 AP-2014]